MGVCTKERKGDTAEVLMATPCTNSLGGESGEQKHEGCGGQGGMESPGCLLLLGTLLNHSTSHGGSTLQG